MDMHVGLDVSQRTTSICIIDASGQRTWQGTALTEPAAIVQAIRAHGAGEARVGMETGPLAVWLYHAILCPGKAGQDQVHPTRPSTHTPT